MAEKREIAILGVGSPLIDAVVRIDERFLAKNIPGGKGGMQPITTEEQKKIISRLADKVSFIPGGSAGNTVSALAQMGFKCAMLGKLGNDEYGRIYRDGLSESGVNQSVILESGDDPTGICLIMVTPDGERTMRTAMNAAAKWTPAEIDQVDFGKYEVVYIEGFGLFTSEVFDRIVDRGYDAGCQIVLDVASYEVARDFKSRILSLASAGKLAMIFCNRCEAEELVGPAEDDDRLQDLLAPLARIAVLKLGAAGAVVSYSDPEGMFRRDFIVAAAGEEVVDTTGAGDWWAAGFFAGYFKGKDLGKCGWLGSLWASEVIKYPGARIPADCFKKLVKIFNPDEVK